MIKAELVELNRDSRRPRRGTRVVVQFNPELLHISHTAGTSTLRMQLWFDVSGDDALLERADVRSLTSRVAYFTTPRAEHLPMVRFSWGTLEFEGTMDAVDETLEFFSDDGRPLRASLGLVLTGAIRAA